MIQGNNVKKKNQNKGIAFSFLMFPLSFLPFLTYLIDLSSPLIIYRFRILPYFFVLLVPLRTLY